MKWYRTADHNELVNLETKEKAKKCFNKIAEKLGTDNFSY